MDINPIDLIEKEDTEDTTEPTAKSDKRKSRLNNAVAIAVALIATFIGVCKIKDDNIVQAMQQAQANKIDDWSWYQSRNIREQVARSTVTQLQLQALSQPPVQQAAYLKQIAVYQALADREAQKKQALKESAEKDQKTYDELNYHDDQFDLADASLSIAVSMFAITSLSQKRWLLYAALVPTTFGLVMGLAGLFSWGLHPDALTKLLSENVLQKPAQQQQFVAKRFE